MSDFTVYRGVEHLDKVATCVSLAIDVETLQLQPEKGKLRLVQLGCLARKTIVIIDCFTLDDKGWDKLRSVCKNGERFWVAHNSLFDVGWLQEHDIKLRGRVSCTMLASRMLNNGVPNLKHSLAAVVLRYLKKEVSKEQQRSDWGAEVLSEEQLTYAAKDVELLLELEPVLQQRLAESRLQKAYALECRAIPAFAAMWRTGLPWNREALQQVQRDYEFDITEIGKEVLVQLDEALPEGQKLPREEDGSFNLRPKAALKRDGGAPAGFNINSPKQLVDKLTAVLGTPPLDPTTGKPGASRAALRNYAADHVVIQTYLAWKKSEKRRQMVVSLLEHQSADGFIRARGLVNRGCGLLGHGAAAGSSAVQGPRDDGGVPGWSGPPPDHGGSDWLRSPDGEGGIVRPAVRRWGGRAAELRRRHGTDHDAGGSQRCALRMAGHVPGHCCLAEGAGAGGGPHARQQVGRDPHPRHRFPPLPAW